MNVWQVIIGANKRAVLLSALLFLFVLCAFPTAAAATAGADGAGNGGNTGTPTNGGGGYTASTSWASATSTTWTVPAKVSEVKIKVWGAGGAGGYGDTGNAGRAGGAGGYAEGVLTVTPGQTLTIDVGAGGVPGTADADPGTGGEFSGVASGAVDWVIAGAGAAAGNSSEEARGGAGGAGGGTTGFGGGGGGAGEDTGDNGGDGGDAGTPTTAGAGGAGDTTGSSGSNSSGGAGGNTNAAGGGGGDGYFGGGGGGSGDNASGGAGGAGGGGSSYVDSGASGIAIEGGSGATTANNSDSDYVSGIGTGGGGGAAGGNAGGSGGDGLVVVWYTVDESAPTPSPLTFSTAPDNLNTSSIDMTASAATDPAGGVEYYFEAVSGSCGADLGTGATDSGWQSSRSYTDSGLQTNKCYSYSATARDGFGNAGATSTVSDAYTSAAVPGVVTFANQSTSTIEIFNNANGNPTSNPATTFAVQVSASSPVDATWDGQYVDASGDPSGTEVWLTDSQLDGLVVRGLTGSTQYTFRSRARNADNDETAFSATSDTNTEGETDPPTPNPSTFSSAPDGASDTSVSMVATTASDASAVEYYFEAVTGSCGADLGTGATDSGLQSSTSYTDTGLESNHCYSYTVTAQDILGNAAATSSASDTYTNAVVPGTLSFDNVTSSSIDLTNNANGNPTSNPATTFAVQVSASSPVDATWDGQYVDASGDPSGTEVWLTDAQIDSLSVTGLDEYVEYTFQVKARNIDGDETSFSAGSATSTLDVTAPTPNPMTFATPPDDASANSVSMIASTANDTNSAVEYYFESVTGSCGADLGTGATDSGWQSSASYTDNGLEVNHCYAYTVRARDAFGNVTSDATAVSAYTAAATPNEPNVSGVGTTTITLINNANGNPTSNPATTFAVQVSASSPVDATWDGQYVDASGDPSGTEVWLTDSQLDGLVVRGLTNLTTYTLQAKARNEANEETSFSSTVNVGTALSTKPQQIQFFGGVNWFGGVNFR